jgi:hypothetical protein
MASEQPTKKQARLQRDAAIVTAYVAGEPMEAIAARLGSSVGTVHRAIKAAGVQSRSNRKDDIQPGSEFGQLTAISPDGDHWFCRCSCGREERAQSTALRQGGHVRCAACRKPEAAPEAKTCTVCKEAKPNTAEFFTRNNQFRFGLKALCKVCFAPKGRAEGLVFRRRLRLEVLTHYAGGEKPSCKCCGEDVFEFLALDHLEGSSQADYKEHGRHFFSWLKRNGYPRKMQVLCHCCNESLGHRGVCVHRPEITRPVTSGLLQRIPEPLVTEEEVAYAFGRLQECYSCKRTLPHSDSFFERHKLMTSGLLNLCKMCSREGNSRRRIPQLAAAREKVLAHYGNACECCGCTEPTFLTIDHVDGGGAQHRRETKMNNIHFWLVKNNFPAGFRPLCWNCNLARGWYKTCPHQRDKPTEKSPVGLS